jgi:hypothetical protein
VWDKVGLRSVTSRVRIWGRLGSQVRVGLRSGFIG